MVTSDNQKEVLKTMIWKRSYCKARSKLAIENLMEPFSKLHIRSIMIKRVLQMHNLRNKITKLPFNLVSNWEDQMQLSMVSPHLRLPMLHMVTLQELSKIKTLKETSKPIISHYLTLMSQIRYISKPLIRTNFMNQGTLNNSEDNLIKRRRLT